MAFEISREMGGVFISKLEGHLFKQKSLIQELSRPPLTLCSQPVFWRLAHLFTEMPFQRAHRNTASLRQSSSIPIR